MHGVRICVNIYSQQVIIGDNGAVQKKQLTRPLFPSSLQPQNNYCIIPIYFVPLRPIIKNKNNLYNNQQNNNLWQKKNL